MTDREIAARLVEAVSFILGTTSHDTFNQAMRQCVIDALQGCIDALRANGQAKAKGLDSRDSALPVEPVKQGGIGWK